MEYKNIKVNTVDLGTFEINDARGENPTSHNFKISSEWLKFKGENITSAGMIDKTYVAFDLSEYTKAEAQYSIVYFVKPILVDTAGDYSIPETKTENISFLKVGFNNLITQAATNKNLWLTDDELGISGKTFLNGIDTIYDVKVGEKSAINAVMNNIYVHTRPSSDDGTMFVETINIDDTRVNAAYCLNPYFIGKKLVFSKTGGGISGSNDKFVFSGEYLALVQIGVEPIAEA